MPPKVCAQRSTKARPAFSKEELVVKAVGRGGDEKALKRLTKQELCRLLKLPLVGTFPPVAKKSSSKKPTSRSPSPKLKKRSSKKTLSLKEPVSKTESVVKKKADAVKKPSKRKSASKSGKTKGRKKAVVSPIRITHRPLVSPSTLAKVDSLRCITKSELPLKSYQLNALRHLVNGRGIIIAFPTGTGKTLTAVVAAFCWLALDKKHRVKVLLSPSLVGNFKLGIEEYGADPEDKRFSFYSYSKFAKRFGDEGGASRRHDDGRCGSRDMLIVDEAHELRTKITASKRNSRAAVAVRCAQKVGKVLLLTATPVFNAERDVINQLSMVLGETPPTEAKFNRLMEDEERFVEKYHGLVAFAGPERKPKPKKKETLFDPLNGITMNCGAFERHAPNFPRVQECDVEIEMDKPYYKAYRKIEQLKAPLNDSNGNPWVFYTGLRQAANKITTDCLKCDFVMDIVRKGKNTVVHSVFLGRGIDIIAEQLEEEGIPYAKVTGSMKAEDRQLAVASYNRSTSDKLAKKSGVVSKNKKKSVKVLLISRAGGQGLDLKGTRYMITMEPGWNPASEEQTRGRAERLDSHKGLKSDRLTVYKLYVTKPYFKWEVDNIAKNLEWTKKQRTAYEAKYAYRSSTDLKHDSADSIIQRLAEGKLFDRMNRLMRRIAIAS